MLIYLKVQNLAVIHEAILEIRPGFVCLTGETGAGKSLVLDALSLLAGMRASADLVRTGCEKAVVEAEFDCPGKRPDLELLDGRSLFLRREINRNGRSRAFVNGIAVPNSTLVNYAGLVYEIHGQSGQQVLLKESAHLVLFDQFAGLTRQVTAFSNELASLKGAHQLYWRAVDDESTRLKTMDFLEHQIREIDEVGPCEDDLDIERRLIRATNHELIRIKRLSIDALVDKKMNPELAVLIEDVQKLAEFEPGLEPYLEQLESMRGLLDELRRDVDGACDMDSDADDLAALESRHSELNRLFLKYGRNLDEVAVERERLSNSLAELQALQDNVKKGWQDLCQQYEALRQSRQALGDARRSAAETFCAEVTSQLSRLSFPRAHFETEINTPPWPDELPQARELKLRSEQMRFLFSPNPGEQPRPLAKIASGGELSRIMLALVTTLKLGHRRTLVFDEVDAGIGGETARHVGQRLASLGRDKQVICVTHLAQVACFADQHFKIEKLIKGGRTLTRLTLCDAEQRVAELARLMGGDAGSESLRQHALAMVTEGRQP